jgi:hypothetical protein
LLQNTVTICSFSGFSGIRKKTIDTTRNSARAPKNFPRLNGIDLNGILCIGKATNLQRRILEFQRDILVEGLRKHYHSESWNFRKYFRDNHNPNALKLEVRNIRVLWKELGSEEIANNFETELIQDYAMMYQDKPPLNISIKRKRS